MEKLLLREICKIYCKVQLLVSWSGFCLMVLQPGFNFSQSFSFLCPSMILFRLGTCLEDPKIRLGYWGNAQPMYFSIWFQQCVNCAAPRVVWSHDKVVAVVLSCTQGCVVQRCAEWESPQKVGPSCCTRAQVPVLGVWCPGVPGRLQPCTDSCGKRGQSDWGRVCWSPADLETSQALWCNMAIRRLIVKAVISVLCLLGCFLPSFKNKTPVYCLLCGEKIQQLSSSLLCEAGRRFMHQVGDCELTEKY